MLYSMLGFNYFRKVVASISRLVGNFYHHAHHNIDMSIVDKENNFVTYRVSAIYSFDGKLFASITDTDKIIEINPINNVLITGA